MKRPSSYPLNKRIVKKRSLKKLLFDEAIIRSWWVILFALFCYMMLDLSGEQQQRILGELQNDWQELETTKRLTLEKQENLWRQIHSQSDPAWIELTLMKGLGVVPEGQTKVHFVEE